MSTMSAALYLPAQSGRLHKGTARMVSNELRTVLAALLSVTGCVLQWLTQRVDGDGLCRGTAHALSKQLCVRNLHVFPGNSTRVMIGGSLTVPQQSLLGRWR